MSREQALREASQRLERYKELTRMREFASLVDERKKYTDLLVQAVEQDASLGVTDKLELKALAIMYERTGCPLVYSAMERRLAVPYDFNL